MLVVVDFIQLLHNAFEYAESTKVEVEGTEASEADAPLVSQNPDQPYLGLATFRRHSLLSPLLPSRLLADWYISRTNRDGDIGG